MTAPGPVTTTIEGNSPYAAPRHPDGSGKRRSGSSLSSDPTHRSLYEASVHARDLLTSHHALTPVATIFAGPSEMDRSSRFTREILASAPEPYRNNNESRPNPPEAAKEPRQSPSIPDTPPSR